MTTVYAEIQYYEGKWRAGIVMEKNGLWACPGLDDYFDTREEAEQDALNKMEDYAAECEDQGEDIQRGGVIGG